MKLHAINNSLGTLFMKGLVGRREVGGIYVFWGGRPRGYLKGGLMVGSE